VDAQAKRKYSIGDEQSARKTCFEMKLVLILLCIAFVIGGLYQLYTWLIGDERKTEFDANYLPQRELLSSDAKGFCLNGKRSLSIEDSFKNALVIGSTGNFKSSGILIPSILKMRGASSFVVTDFSGELANKTSGALLNAGYEVKILNWGEPSVSEGYNPILHLRSTSDIQKLSKMLIVNALGTNSKDPFWNLSSESLCGLAMRYIVEHTPRQFHTLHNVYRLISAMSYDPEKIDLLFVKASPALLSEYKSFLAYSKALFSVIATCRSALSIFGTDPQVALTTSHDTIDISEFRKKKVCLFINTNTNDMRYYSLATSIFLEQFFGDVMSKPASDKDFPLFFLIDEASSLYFSGLQLVLSNIRKSRCGILQVYQSASQIIDLYNQSIARAITENSFAKVYMGGQQLSVAQELSATMGNWEYIENDVRHIRPLATPSEIHEGPSLIFCGNHRAIKTEITPYFKQRKLLRLTELPPYVPQNKLPFSEPPLLPL